MTFGDRFFPRHYLSCNEEEGSFKTMNLKGVQNFASSKVDLRKDLIVKQSVLKGLQSV